MIKVSSAGVRYFLNYENRKTPAGGLRSLLLGKSRKEFWALQDVSFEIQKGEIFGVIGSNAAGKSTLLKALAGIIPATQGEISVYGNIAPLIELGAAFNPELTGLENIYLSGSIYRIPRKVIRDSLEKIIDFSGLRRFIHTPVKNYSSGMFIRLAFSIVIFFRPDVVLIDEVFSVGDAVFQQRSFERMLFFKERGAAIVLVSHDLSLISQTCGRVLVLSKGKMSFIGPAEEAIGHYLQLIKSREGLEEDSQRPEARATETDSRRWGNRTVEILGVKFMDEKGDPKSIFSTGEHFEARISFVSHLSGAKAVFGVALSTIYKMLIYGPNTLEGRIPDSLPAQGTIRFIIPSLPLFEGDYLFSASAYDPSLMVAYDHHEMMYSFRVISRGTRDFGCVRIDSRWDLEPGAGSKK